jgi:hypothetical protein
MENPEDKFFETTSNVSLIDLKKEYNEMLRADAVLLLAEHKNFKAAKMLFETWDDALVSNIRFHLSKVFVHSEWAKESRDLYIAYCYLMKLIRNKDQGIDKYTEDEYQESKATLRRLAGVLPKIDISGTVFTIDWKRRELRETDNPANKLDIRSMVLNGFKDGYESFYNTTTRQSYVVPDDIMELPQHVMLLEIPIETKLDPVAVAVELGLDELGLANGNPVRTNLKGYLYPLEQTLLPQVIAENLRLNQNNGRQNRLGR